MRKTQNQHQRGDDVDGQAHWLSSGVDRPMRITTITTTQNMNNIVQENAILGLSQQNSPYALNKSIITTANIAKYIRNSIGKDNN